MKKTSYTLLIFGLLLLPAIIATAQTENYEKGLKAINANKYHEAMTAFTRVVSNEKFDITGKELATAYAYLAIIRIAYLERALEKNDFNSINQSQGQIQQTIQEMSKAIRFKDSKTKSLIKNAKVTLAEISLKALLVIGDSLMSYDENKPNEESMYLASFAIKQFGELEKIESNWQVHDILGLAHFHLNDRITAMEEFAKARKEFATLEVQPKSQLHLQNFVLSGNYFFKEQNNMEQAYIISNEGSEYTSALINGLDDNQMTVILKLNKIENRFRSVMARIDESGE